MMGVRLTICLVNWNTRDDLRECLRSLKQFPCTIGETEIVVVDNGSTDGSADAVRTEFPDIHLIANATNTIFAHGVNQCLSAATGEILLLLNPDITVGAGAIDALVHFLETSPYDVVAPRLVYPTGETQRSIRGFPAPWPLLFDILQLWRLLPSNHTLSAYRMPYFDYAAPNDAPQPMASALLMACTVYNKIGGMDERFPLFFNDADWCLRVWEAGLRIGYTPTAVFGHKGGATTKKVRIAGVWESHRALLRFYAKHYRQKTPRLLYYLITTLVTLGAWLRTKRWGKSLGRDGGETTPADLHRELEREG